MRTLKFIVTGQNIRPDPGCDFSGLIPGTEGYLHALFTFDNAWSKCWKMAVFQKYLDSEKIPVQIKDDECDIPSKVLTARRFEMSVIGLKPGYKITTNKVGVMQDG